MMIKRQVKVDVSVFFLIKDGGYSKNGFIINSVLENIFFILLNVSKISDFQLCKSVLIELFILMGSFF